MRNILHGPRPTINRFATLREPPERDGRVLAVASQKSHERPFFLTGDQPDTSLSVSADLSAQFTMTNSGDGPIEITRLAAHRTGAMTVLLSLGSGRQPFSLMNAPVHIDTMMGSGANPYILPEALYLHAGHSLSAAFQDVSGSANNVRLAFPSAKYTSVIYDPRLEEVKRRFQDKERMSMPFWYTFNQGAVTLSGDASSQVPIDINGGHHFLLTHISGTSTGRYSLNILDAYRNFSVIDAPEGTTYRIPDNLIVGDNNYPFRFEQGIFFEEGSRLIVDMLDTSGSSNTIYLTLGGIVLADKMWK